MGYLTEAMERQAGRFPASSFSLHAPDLVEQRSMTAKQWSEIQQQMSISSGESFRDCVIAALTEQVGPAWSGLDSLEPIRTIFIVLLAAHAAGLDVSDTLADMNAWSLSCRHGTPVSIDPKIFLDDKIYQAAMPIIEEAAARHHYTSGVLIDVIAAAKRVGVLPNSKFLWVKPHDLHAWELLDDCGRQVHSASILAAIIHARVEGALGKPESTVYQENCIETLLSLTSIPKQEWKEPKAGMTSDKTVAV